MGFKEFFGFFVSMVQKAFAAAKANGLTDKLVNETYGLAQKAAEQFDDDTDAARAWVLAKLKERGVPESLGRFALEAAVQILKRERQ